MTWKACDECPISEKCVLRVKKTPGTKICFDQLFDMIYKLEEARTRRFKIPDSWAIDK